MAGPGVGCSGSYFLNTTGTILGGSLVIINIYSVHRRGGRYGSEVA